MATYLEPSPLFYDQLGFRARRELAHAFNTDFGTLPTVSMKLHPSCCFVVAAIEKIWEQFLIWIGYTCPLAALEKARLDFWRRHPEQLAGHFTVQGNLDTARAIVMGETHGDSFIKAIQWDLIHLYGGEHPVIFLEDSPGDATSLPSHVRFGYSPRQVYFWDDLGLRRRQFAVIKAILHPKWMEIWMEYKRALGESIPENYDVQNARAEVRAIDFRNRKPPDWSQERFQKFHKEFAREVRSCRDHLKDLQAESRHICFQRSLALGRALEKTHRLATRIFAIAGDFHVQDLEKQPSPDVAYIHFAETGRDQVQLTKQHVQRLLSCA